MIDLKVDEEQPEDELRIEFTEEQKQAFVNAMKTNVMKGVAVCDNEIVKELHQLNGTLKEILREMKKRKV